MNKGEALHNFWAQFLPAYDENTVPPIDEVTFPYITYETSTDNFGNTLSLTGNLWYRSSTMHSWREISAKAEEIANTIDNGQMYEIDGGGMLITRRSPFAQRMSEPSDDTIRRIMIQINVEFLTTN